MRECYQGAPTGRKERSLSWEALQHHYKKMGIPPTGALEVAPAFHPGVNLVTQVLCCSLFY